MVTKTITINLSNHTAPVNAETFIKFFRDELDQVPEENRSTATFDLECREDRYGEEYVSIDLEFDREETNEEAILRCERDLDLKSRRDLIELAEYNRLKLKFED